MVFDAASGTIPNEGGRVEPGVYVAGWIKRGPTGVIGTNKKDATETVELLLEDAAASRLEPKPDASAAAVDALLAERSISVVEYAGWTAIDKAERAAGERSGRPRVKLCSWDELLATRGPSELRPASPPRGGERLPASMRRPMGPDPWTLSSSNAFSAARAAWRGATASSTSKRPSAPSAATSAGHPCSR